MSLVWAWEVFLKRSFNESDKGLFIFFAYRNFGFWLMKICVAIYKKAMDCHARFARSQ